MEFGGYPFWCIQKLHSKLEPLHINTKKKKNYYVIIIKEMNWGVDYNTVKLRDAFFSWIMWRSSSLANKKIRPLTSMNYWRGRFFLGKFRTLFFFFHRHSQEVTLLQLPTDTSVPNVYCFSGILDNIQRGKQTYKVQLETRELQSRCVSTFQRRQQWVILR